MTILCSLICFALDNIYIKRIIRRRSGGSPHRDYDLILKSPVAIERQRGFLMLISEVQDRKVSW